VAHRKDSRLSIPGPREVLQGKMKKGGRKMIKSSLSHSNKKVCMCLYNNFTHDSRVFKEALSLYEAGYSITVLALLDGETLPFENKNGIIVKRISANSFVLRIARSSVERISAKLFSTRIDIIIDKKNNESFSSYAKEEKITFLDHTTFLLSSLLLTILNLLFVIFMNVKELKRALTILNFNYRILRDANLEKYDVFHAHDLNTLIGAYLAARKQSAKLIYDSHELFMERNRFEPYRPIDKWIRKKVEAYLIKRSDHVITVNDSLAKELADNYKVRLPTIVMNTPSRKKESVSAQCVSLRHVIGIQDNYHILLYSGAITRNRGLENLIQSLVYLPQCFLVLMGYGNDVYKNKLRTVARERGVDSRFAFFGPVPSDQVVLYAGSADLGVAPIENVCLSYYYCSPNKLFEYLHAGIPVIASDFPEMSRIINQYGVGITFDPSTPEDIARAAREILQNPEKWQNLEEKTHSLVSVYNWENESRKLIDVYRSLA